MLKAILFDIDGVLMDSFDANLAYYQKILSAAGYPAPTEAEYRSIFHLPFVEALQHFAQPKDGAELERIKMIGERAYYPMERLKAPRGVNETLHTLAKTYRLGIVSSRRRVGIERYFAFAGTKECFSVVIGREETRRPKPDPEPLLLAAAGLAVPAKDCAYIGDAHTDIEAGLAAGMKTVLFGDAEHSSAHARVQTFAELPSVLAVLE